VYQGHDTGNTCNKEPFARTTLWRKIVMKRFLAAPVFFIFLIGCISFQMGPTIGPLEESVVRNGVEKTKIAVIQINGVISDASKTSFSGSEIEVPLTVRIKEECDLIRSDPKVRALLIRIDSPGGGVSTCDIIYNEIMQLKREKKIPVVVEMVGIAASGGVYIAAAGDVIIAQPTTVTGSIGVIAQMVRFKDLLDKVGVQSDVIKSGDKKDMGSPFREMTKEERALFQDVINSMYERFLSVILTGRKKLDEKKLRSFADGRIFTAKTALEYGLIDAIGYTDDAIAAAEKSAGISNAMLVSYSRPGKYTPNIYSSSAAQSASIMNLFSSNMSVFENSTGCRFMYIMQP
jgi:protease IV